MYANSPTRWTPVPLPDEISAAAHTPHDDNIRAEIEQAAMLFDVDVQMMNAFAEIESSYKSESQDRAAEGIGLLSVVCSLSENPIKNWSVAKVTIENEKFVHENVH